MEKLHKDHPFKIEILMSFGSLYRTYKAESQNFKDPVLAKHESQYKARF